MAAAGVRAMETALDVGSPQIAIDFPEDPHFRWHHRLLLNRVGDGTKWVVSTPDYNVEVLDLANHRVVTLPRGCQVPARVRGNIYMFGDLSEDHLLSLQQQGEALAVLIGGVATAPSRGIAVWVVSDTGADQFGEQVDSAVTSNPARFVQRGSTALGLIEDRWAALERVAPADLEEWKEEKRSGAGRDPRVMPITRDGRDHRYVEFCDAMAMLQKRTPVIAAGAGSSSASDSDWPFRGPSAAVELMTIIRSTGETIGAYHDHWVRASGVGPDSAVAHHHASLMIIFHHALCFDQLEVYRLAGMEMPARRVMYVERATKRSLKSPDFRGLEMMMAWTLDSGTAAATGDFAEFIAEERKTEAFTLKQQRLFAEESDRRKKDGPKS